MTRLIASTLAFAAALSAAPSALATEPALKLDSELAAEAALLTGRLPASSLQLPLPRPNDPDFRLAARGGFVAPQLSLVDWAARPPLLAWSLLDPLPASFWASVQPASPSPAPAAVLDLALIKRITQALGLRPPSYVPAHQMKNPAMLPWPPARDHQPSPAWDASVAHPPMQLHFHIEASF